MSNAVLEKGDVVKPLNGKRAGHEGIVVEISKYRYIVAFPDGSAVPYTGTGLHLINQMRPPTIKERPILSPKYLHDNAYKFMRQVKTGDNTYGMVINWDKLYNLIMECF